MINYNGAKLEINTKYYSIIEKYPDELRYTKLSFDTYSIEIIITSYLNDAGEDVILIVVCSDDLQLLNDILEDSSFYDESIYINKELI